MRASPLPSLLFLFFTLASSPSWSFSIFYDRVSWQEAAGGGTGILFENFDNAVGDLPMSASGLTITELGDGKSQIADSNALVGLLMAPDFSRPVWTTTAIPIK
jgi:hypothetical protein